MDTIYLDYNATTPVDPRVAEAMQPFIQEHFGNPSSSHIFGVKTKVAVELARKQLSQALGCEADEIVFTSGGSESNNYAIKGAAYANKHKGNHIITSAIEHPAVTEVCRFLQQQGFRISYLPVNDRGQIVLDDLRREITSQTILITLMHANNEVGTILPIQEASRIAKENGILIHTDCAQSFGKIPVNAQDLGVDLLTIAGHKLYAPKGIGALYVRTGTQLEKLIHGADHERNSRAGTENVAQIVGLGKASEIVQLELKEESERLQSLRDRFEESILEKLPETRINGDKASRLPNTSSMSFPGIEANTILSELSSVAVSAGAACHSDDIDVSPVLSAMGIPVETAMGTIRFSFGRFSTEEDMVKASQSLLSVLSQLSLKSVSTPSPNKASEIKLTQYTHGLGCACKMRPQLLEEVLKKMPVIKDENVLVGTDTCDDAAVYRIDKNTYLVQTVDFFTPVVDDPYTFGQIAAANSLSDIYAMGAKPLFALNIVGFPSHRLPIEVLESILLGAQKKVGEAGISILGGHTVEDNEPKFGLVVTGLCDKKSLTLNKGAQPGDELILTKPLGTGVLSTALKQGFLDKDSQDCLYKNMTELNKKAALALEGLTPHACTDVTGFGLLGHLLEILKASNVSAELNYSKLPFLPQAQESAMQGIIPGGTMNNHSFTERFVTYDESLSPAKRYLVNDAQTSGGLLVCLSPEDVKMYNERLPNKTWRIGTIDSLQDGSRQISMKP
jgi:cysteine desulfurase